MQQEINRLSLVYTIPEDIVKACKQNGLSPAMTEIVIRLHNQQLELQKACNEILGVQHSMALLLDRMVDSQNGLVEDLQSMHKRIGYGEEDMVSAEEIGANND